MLNYHMSSLISLVLFIKILQSVYCTKLFDYGINYNDKVFDKETPGFIKNRYHAPRSVTFNITEIPLFRTNCTFIRIFETGVVSYDKVILPLCPDGNFKCTDSYIAAYWVQADLAVSGHVYYRQELVDAGNAAYYKYVVDEINRGQKFVANSSWKLKTSDLKSIIIITWKDMKPEPSFFVNQNHRNTFQLVIISTSIRSYALVLYERLDYFFVYSQSYSCSQAAVVGLNTDSPSKYFFQLTSYFYLQPYNLLLYTTISNYEVLRRYLMIIEYDVVQPQPPSINCVTEDPMDADPYCVHGIPPYFCAVSPPGIYSHPSDCKKFVLCGNGGTMNIESCGDLFYNPFFQVCDWSGYYACNSRMYAYHSGARILGNAMPDASLLISIRDDINVNQHVAFHNNTCFGQPEWGNVEDISSCVHYLMCSNTRTYRVSCPLSWNGEPLYYNREKNMCDYQRNVQCDNGARPFRPTVPFSPTPKTTSPTRLITTIKLPSLVCAQTNGYVNVPDPESCSRYFSCRDGKPLNRHDCQKDYLQRELFYNPETNACDYQPNVKCRAACSGSTFLCKVDTSASP